MTQRAKNGGAVTEQTSSRGSSKRKEGLANVLIVELGSVVLWERKIRE